MIANSIVVATLIINNHPSDEWEKLRYEAFSKLNNKHYAEVTFHDTQVSTILHFIEITTGSSFDVYYRGEDIWSDEVGIVADTPLTLEGHDLTALTLLEWTLDRISNEVLTYTWQLDDNGHIMIGSETKLAQETRIEVYDVNDLLFNIRDYTVIPKIDLNTALADEPSPFSFVEDREPTDFERNIMLSQIIKRHIFPNRWRDCGGNCIIDVIDNQLIVKAPDYIHRAINGYSFKDIN